MSGLDFADDSRAFAVTDIDNDGNLDIILKSRRGPQVRVLRNHCGTGRHSMALRLRGVKSNRDAIGARVEVNGRVYHLSAGSGYLSQHSKQMQIGLGEATEADVAITWPSGLRQTFANLRAGFRYRIEEGSPDAKGQPFAPRQPILADPVKGINQAAFGATWLFEPVPLPEKRSGPGFLLLSAGSAAAPAGVPFEIVDVTRESPDLAALYAIFRRYLFELRTDLELPLLLLIDESSRAHKVYTEIPPAPVLAADYKQLLDGPRPELALPFPGHYCLPPTGITSSWAPHFTGPAIPIRRSPIWTKWFAAIPTIGRRCSPWARFTSMPSAGSRRSETFERVIAIRPDYAAALMGAGETYEKLSDLPAAEKMLRRAADADSKNADAANQLGLVLARQDRAAEAKQWFERAMSIDPAHTGAINNLAVLFIKLGRTTDAIAAFRYGIAKAPGEESLYLNLGRLYISMGDRQKARDVMHQLLDQKPDDPVAVRALRELDLR